MKDRSGILLVLAGTLLILGNMWSQGSAAGRENPPGADQGQPGSSVCGAGQCWAGDVLSDAVGGQSESSLNVADQDCAGGSMAGVSQGQSGSNVCDDSRARVRTMEVDNSSVLEGDLRIAGSSSMERYASALAEGFMEKYPGVDVTVQFTGSSAGIAAVTGGSAEIGISSRYLEDEEKAAGAVETIVGLDGIAVCVNPANGVHDLTREELAAIYSGRISSWSQLGGSDLPVVVTGREAGSGTRSAFEGLLGLKDRCIYANELDSAGAVGARITATPGAIGYLSLEAAQRLQNGVRDSEAEGGAEDFGKGKAGVEVDRAEGSEEAQIRILALDGTEPSIENITDGTYPLYRPFVMVTKGAPEDQIRPVYAWFAYVFSEEGSGIAEKMRIVVTDEANALQ